MYKVAIPVALHDRFDPCNTLKELKRAKAERVFLAIGTVSFDSAKRKKILAQLKDNITFFQSNGLETGVWLWSFLRQDPESDNRGCTLQMNHKGDSFEGAYCPASSGFLQDSEDFITEVAKLGPDIIQFDDDYRLLAANENSVGCFCEHHMEMIHNILGESLTREEVYKRAFAGKANKYRTAIMKSNGSSMENFARKMRKAVDQINPNIRISLCSCMPTWDQNGTNSIKITKLLAGDTKPLMRLDGAPYWCVYKNWGNRLSHVVELSRLQSSWCDHENIEIVSEGDVYPRPRYCVPANYLEGFDTAMRFSGETDGILKYMVDYTSTPRYETGYIDRHVKHRKDYEKIDQLFSEMESVGVRVYNAMTKFEAADTENINEPPKYAWDLHFPREAWVLNDNSIPTTYRGYGLCGITFGENARHLPKEAFQHGLILDVRAAKILMEQGIDVGLEKIGNSINTQMIHYLTEEEHTISGYDFHSTYEVIPKPGAEVICTSYSEVRKEDQSTWSGGFNSSIEGKEYPDVIRFTNAKGQKFLIFAFDAIFTNELRWRSYSMQKLLMDSVEWLSSQFLPAKCQHHPDLYVQCKKTEGALGVGLWNFFADEIDTPVITLNHAYQNIEFVNCTGKLNQNIVELDQMAPYSYACFKVW